MMANPSPTFWQGFRASDEDLAIPRMIVGVAILTTQVPKGLWLSHLPDPFLSSPLSVGAVFSSFPSAGLLVTLNILIAVAAAMLLIGCRTVVASVATSLLLIGLHSLTTMTGKIDHNILLAITPLVMAKSGWGRFYSWDALRSPDIAEPQAPVPAVNWSITLLALIIALAMFTAAVPKFLNGWMAPDTSATYGYLFANHYVTGRENLLTVPMLMIPPGLFWEMQDWATLVVESIGVLLLWKQRTFTAWLLVLMGFHLGVGLTFDIWFSANTVAYSVFLPWSRLTRTRGLGKPAMVYALLGIGVLLVGYGITKTVLFRDWPGAMQDFKKWGSLVITVSVAVSGAGFAWTILKSTPSAGRSEI